MLRIADISSRLEEFAFSSDPAIRLHFDISGMTFILVATTDHPAIRITDMPADSYEDILQFRMPCLPPPSVKELRMRVDGSPMCSQALAFAQIFPSVETLVIRFEPSEEEEDLDSDDEPSDMRKMPEAPILAIYPSVSYVPILTWYGSIPSAMLDSEGLAARVQKGNCIARLVVELPVWREASFAVSDLEQYADVVEVARTSSCTLMDVPEVCRNHHWPEWPEISVGHWEHLAIEGL